MKTSKLLVFSILAATFVSYFLLISPGSVSAQGVQDFVIESFDASYDLSNEDPQGLLKTTEKIQVNFSGQNRGILRAIPEIYGDIKTNPEILEITRDGKKEPYTLTGSENNNMIIRIGDPSVYITGQHSYEIVYKVENVIKFYENHDELYWDVNGTEWLQPFVQTTAKVTSGVQLVEPRVTCFVGSYGSVEKTCTTTDEATRFSVKSGRELGPRETLTIVAAFEKGYFTPLAWYEKYRNLLVSSPLILFNLLVIRSAHKKWAKIGKDYKKRGITVPYFERPKGLSVMQASYVLENKLLPTHISASIIDLAIRGYIRVTEKKERFKTKHDLTLTKLLDSSLSDDEQLLLNELFGTSAAIDTTVQLEDKKNKLYEVVSSLSKLLDEKSTTKGFYELSPVKATTALGKQWALVVLGLVSGIVMTSYSNGLTLAGGLLALIATFIYSALMTKRSMAGNMLVEHMEGLKLYLNQAEKDRIKNQDAVAAPLSPRSGQPIRDVKFFEKLLPYAVATGLEKTWAKAFSDIYTQQPDWYSGNWKTFSAVALADSLHSTASATGTAFSAPSSSGGSGFSGGGGGFSGGGGGGGGGGGW